MAQEPAQDLAERMEKLEARVEDAWRLAGAGPRPIWRMCQSCEFIFCVGIVPQLTAKREIRYCPACGGRDIRERH